MPSGSLYTSTKQTKMAHSDKNLSYKSFFVHFMAFMSLCQDLVSSGEKLVNSDHYAVIQSVVQRFIMIIGIN